MLPKWNYQSQPLYLIFYTFLISFGCALGGVFVGLAIGLGSPAWVLLQIQQRTKVPPVRETTAALPLPVFSAPKTTPTKRPTPAATPTPDIAPTPVMTATPVVAPTERTGFYVIGMASREEASTQAEAQKYRQEGLNPQVIYSSDWSGLTPNYYQVVYGIFAHRADTAALRKDLEQRGIKTYVMHSGQRVRP